MIGSNTLARELRTIQQKKDFTIVIDSREQRPFAFPPEYSVITKKLDVGDYSILGFENKITIERKELGDLVGCCGRERERFEREMEKLRGFYYRGIICEGSESQIKLKQYRGAMHPNSILGSILGWEMRGVTVWMCGTRYAAQIETLRRLEHAWRHFNRKKVEDKSIEQTFLGVNLDAQNPFPPQLP